MNQLQIEQIKASSGIIPIDIYFIVKQGSYNHFSKLITIHNEQQQVNQVIQIRNDSEIVIECWAYDLMVVEKPFLGRVYMNKWNKFVKFEDLEVQLRVHEQERCKTPELAIKRGISPLRKGNMTPNRRKG